MAFKSLVAALCIALVASVGTASAQSQQLVTEEMMVKSPIPASTSSSATSARPA